MRPGHRAARRHERAPLWEQRQRRHRHES
jgi:hypothetical protein